MRRLVNIGFTLVGLMSIGISRTAMAQTPVATYQFSGNLLADQGGVTALTAVNPAGNNAFISATPFGVSRTVYRFAGDQANGSSSQALEGGLQLNTTGLISSNSYSVEMVVSLDQVNGYRRLTDTQDRALDTGFYEISGGLQDYNQPGSSLTGFAANTYYDVLLTVSNAASNNVSAYLNGTPYFTVTTTASNIATNFMNFFLDNSNNEYSNGEVALIRLYDSPLTATDAVNIYNNGNPFPGVTAAPTPEPGMFGLIAALGSTGIALARRRRKNGASA